MSHSLVWSVISRCLLDFSIFIDVGIARTILHETRSSVIEFRPDSCNRMMNSLGNHTILCVTQTYSLGNSLPITFCMALLRETRTNGSLRCLFSFSVARNSWNRAALVATKKYQNVEAEHMLRCVNNTHWRISPGYDHGG